MSDMNKDDSVYDEAIAMGLTRRDAGLVAFSKRLLADLSDLKERQSAFLDHIGLTWDEARAMGVEERAALNEKWRAYDGENAADTPVATMSSAP